MPINFSQARFIKGAHNLDQCLPDTGMEVAVAGRSNVGKSSALNVITGVNGLARASRQPGRTRQINYFELARRRYLVDLPGYGYAKVPPKLRQHWDQTLGAYFTSRKGLVGLLLIMDIRHPLKDLDQQMLNWVSDIGIPTHCLLTKSDKLKHGPASTTLLRVRSRLEEVGIDIGVQLFSAVDRHGLDEARRKIEQWLEQAH